MNPVTLAKLMKNREETLSKTRVAKEKLDDFCEKHWGFTYNDIEHINGQDEIVESLDYGNSTTKLERFIELMDAEKAARKREDAKIASL